MSILFPLANISAALGGVNMNTKQWRQNISAAWGLQGLLNFDLDITNNSATRK